MNKLEETIRDSNAIKITLSEDELMIRQGGKVFILQFRFADPEIQAEFSDFYYKYARGLLIKLYYV